MDDRWRNCSSRKWAWFEAFRYETGTRCWRFVVVILTIRCWAVWNRDRRLTIGLPIFFFLSVVAVIVILVICLPTVQRELTWLATIHTLMSSFQDGLMPFPELRGCVLVSGSPVLFYAWIIFMVYEAGVLLHSRYMPSSFDTGVRNVLSNGFQRFSKL